MCLGSRVDDNDPRFSEIRQKQMQAKILFSDQRVRQQFIKKVLLLVFIQLLIIIGGVTIVFSSDELQEWIWERPFLKWIFIGIQISLMVILCCCPGIASTFPGNYIVLFVYTFSITGMIGILAAFYYPEAFLKAGAATTIVVFIVACIAWLIPIDFTKYIMIVFAVSMSLMVLGIFILIFPTNLMLNIYSGLGVLIFSVWLIIDLQMMIGGNHQMALGPDDYCMGALCITADIVAIFLHLLQFFSD